MFKTCDFFFIGNDGCFLRLKILIKQDEVASFFWIFAEV